MKQAENKNSEICARSNGEDARKSIYVFESFVCDRQAYNCVNQISIYIEICKDAEQKSDAVTESKKWNVFKNMFRFIQKKISPQKGITGGRTR